jgi:hypothetical protein
VYGVVGRARLIEADDGLDEVGRTLVRVERGEVADDREGVGDAQLPAKGGGVASGDLGVLDGHPQNQDLGPRDAPLGDGVGL